MSRSCGVIRAITVSSSSKRRAPLGGGTTGRKEKKHRKMGEKRHFEPVKRAEARFPENPTNHSSPPARRRQKIAPLRHSSPPLRPSRPHRHLPPSPALIRSLRLPHTLAILPRPPLSCRHRSDDVKHHHPPNLVHIPGHLRLSPLPIARHSRTQRPIPSPLFCGSATTIRSIRVVAKHPNGTISTLSPPLNIILRIVCRAFLLPQPPCRFAGRHNRSQASRMCSARLT